MLALFLTLSVALALLVWGEIDTPRPVTVAPAPPQMPAPAPLRRPGRRHTPSEPPLRLTDFTPGDLIELELPGPAPHPEDICFMPLPSGDTRVQIAGEDVLILSGVDAATLSPAIFRFRRLPTA